MVLFSCPAQLVLSPLHLWTSVPSLCCPAFSCLFCVSPFFSISLHLSLPISLSVTRARTHTQRSYTCQHTRFSTSSHPDTPRTSLAGELDCHAPEGHSPQGWGRWTGQYMPSASCSSLQPTPHPYSTQCWLCRGYRPWPLSPEHHACLPTWGRCPTSGQGRPMAPGLLASALSITLGSGHTAPDLPSTLSTPHFLPLHTHTPHSGSFLSPHIWHKSAPPPARPCLVVPRA